MNGVPLHTESVDFVKNYDNGDTVEFTYKNYIPDFAPSGTYGLTFTFVNNAGKDNGCLAFTFKLWSLLKIKLICYYIINS